jgi:hypothetical protein
MKITIQHDDGKTEVFQHVTDAYLCVRQLEPMQGKKGKTAVLPETKSYSWGARVRELVKELAQSTLELQDYLKKLRDGGSS